MYCWYRICVFVYVHCNLWGVSWYQPATLWIKFFVRENRQHSLQRRRCLFFLLDVHGNRIEFIVANWISVFIVFILSTLSCDCDGVDDSNVDDKVDDACAATAAADRSTQQQYTRNRLVTCHKTKSTSLHFIYQSASEPIISIIISEILRIMYMWQHSA